MISRTSSAPLVRTLCVCIWTLCSEYCVIADDSLSLLPLGKTGALRTTLVVSTSVCMHVRERGMPKVIRNGVQH